MQNYKILCVRVIGTKKKIIGTVIMTIIEIEIVGLEIYYENILIVIEKYLLYFSSLYIYCCYSYQYHLLIFAKPKFFIFNDIDGVGRDKAPFGGFQA